MLALPRRTDLQKTLPDPHTMTLRTFVSLGATALALGGFTACTSTPTSNGFGERNGSSAHTPLSEEEALAQMVEMAATGPAHADLTARAGTWKVDYKYRMGSDMPWLPMQGTITAKPVLGGRYLLEEHTVETPGLPMEGLLLLGFDNSAQEYISLWMDSNSTWWLEARGQKSADGVTTLSGTLRDSADERPYRTKTWTPAPGVVESETYDTIDGREVLIMSYTSRRASE